MAKRSFITVKDFTEKYETDDNLVYSYLGRFENTGFYIERKGKPNLVDENYFIRRKNFKRFIWMRSHEYYFAMTENNTQYAIAGLLSKYMGGNKRSWNSWMSQALFSLSMLDSSIADTKLPLLNWKFYRFCRAFDRINARMEKKYDEN